MSRSETRPETAGTAPPDAGPLRPRLSLRGLLLVVALVALLLAGLNGLHASRRRAVYLQYLTARKNVAEARRAEAELRLGRTEPGHAEAARLARDRASDEVERLSREIQKAREAASWFDSL